MTRKQSLLWNAQKIGSGMLKAAFTLQTRVSKLQKVGKLAIIRNMADFSVVQSVALT